MIIKRRMKKFVTMALCLVMILGSAIPAFAATPNTEEISYEGNGKVEVEFYGKVSWKNPVVKVTDSTGKTYKAIIVKKDNDDITFKINNAKPGTTYTFNISGVKKRNTNGFGTVTGQVSIPSSTIKSTVAKTTAITNAVNKHNVIKATIRDLEVEKDTYRGKTVWEVSFEAKKVGRRGLYEFEYKIDAKTGTILKFEEERD